jgi:hypothetical protein
MYDQLFNTEYHAPDYVQQLQNLVQPDMHSFEGKNFVDWSHSQGFIVTDPGLHPLEDSHLAACKLWQPIYANALNI